MDLTAGNLVTILAAIGSLALIVSVVTEVTKDVVILKKIPSDIKVIVLSLTLTLVTYFAYISYSGTDILWYYVSATIIAGFIVAYVVMYGWVKLTDLYKRFRNIPPIDLTANPIPEASPAVNASITDLSTDKYFTAFTPELQLTDTSTIDTSTSDVPTTDISATGGSETIISVSDIVIIDTSVTDTATTLNALTDTTTTDIQKTNSKAS